MPDAPAAFPQAERVGAYARAVLDGQIVAGRHVVAACRRHFEDLERGSARGLVWQPARAESALTFFENCLFLDRGRPFRLQPFQAFIVGSVFGWYRHDQDNGALRRRFRTLYAELGKGNGKALALDTPLPTPTGWTTMGEVRAGDTLFDELGRPCRVLAAHPVQVGNPCYRVRFSDGAEIVADAEHLWRTWPMMATSTRAAQIKTTKQISRTLYRDHRVEAAPVLGGEARALPLTRQIVACDPVPSVPVRCIAVDSPSRLFLAGRHLVPTHNTPLAAGIGLYGLTLDPTDAPEIFAAAVAKDQARICFTDAKRMVRASPELAKRVTVLTNSLSVPGRSAAFKVLSSEDKGHHGLRVHMGLLDEIHAHASSAVVDTIEAGTKNCRNSLIVLITNSGSSRQGPCWAYHSRALDMLGGKPDDTLFAFVASLDPCPACLARGARQVNLKCRSCDDWRDLGVLVKANPGLGTILDREYLRERVSLGKTMPSKRNNVLQLNCCVWTEANNGWLDMHAWRSRCAKPGLTLEQFRGRRCWIGLDAANRVDVTCLAILFELEPDGGALDPASLPAAAQEALREAAGQGTEGARVEDQPASAEPAAPTLAIAAAGYALFLRSYVPEAKVANTSEANHEAYQLWAQEGHIAVTPGAITDFARIEADLEQLSRDHEIVRLQADPRELGYLLQRVSGASWCTFPVVEVVQGPGMISQPMKYFEGLVAAGLIRHDGNPVLDWMLGNVEQKTTRGGSPVKFYYPVKPSPEKKIDAAPAAFMALDGALRQSPASAPPGFALLG